MFGPPDHRAHTPDLAGLSRLGSGPAAPAVVAPSVPEEEHLNALTAGAEVLDRAEPGAHQVAHGLIGVVRHVDEGEFAGPEQAREVAGVAAVGLDVVAGLLGHVGRGNDADEEALGGEMA